MQINQRLEIQAENSKFSIINNTLLENNELLALLQECKNNLKKFYNNINNNNLILLTINIKGNKTINEFYNPLYINKLQKLNISICDNLFINADSNCSDYTIQSIIKNSCIECKDNYYPINGQYEANNYKELTDIAKNKSGFIKINWCGNQECEDKIKNDFGIKSRCLIDDEEVTGPCTVCGSNAKNRLYVGRQY